VGWVFFSFKNAPSNQQTTVHCTCLLWLLFPMYLTLLRLAVLLVLLRAHFVFSRIAGCYVWAPCYAPLPFPHPAPVITLFMSLLRVNCMNTLYLCCLWPHAEVSVPISCSSSTAAVYLMILCSCRPLQMVFDTGNEPPAANQAVERCHHLGLD
jgi:hypothetical protein